MKKIITILLTISVFIATFLGANNTVYADSVPTIIDTYNLYKSILKNTDYLANIEKPVDSEANYLKNKIHEKLSSTNYFETLEKYGLTEDTNTLLPPVKLTDPRTGFSVYSFQKCFKNDDGDTALSIIVYDEFTESLSVVSIDLINNNHEFVHLYSFNETPIYPSPVLRAKTFSAFTKDFTCGMAGVIACGAYCAMLGAMSPAVSLGCGIICGTAFTAACASGK